MNFELSDEQRELRETLRRFFEREAPIEVIRELDRAEEFPRELYRKMAEIGLCGMTISERYGGTPLDGIGLCIAGEEMQRAGGCLCYAFMPTVGFAARGIEKFGSDEQRSEYLPGIAAGELRFAMALTEPGSGSDLSSLATRARRTDDGWVVSGQKVFSTGADTADFLFTFVRADTGDGDRPRLSVLIIPRTAPGVTIRPLRKLAAQAVHTCEVFLDEVIVPEDALLGELGKGSRIIFELLDGERILVGAQSCGMAAGALDLALEYAGERVQFGRPVADFQAVGHKLANMKMDLEASRLIVFQAAWKHERGIPCSLDAAMAKVAGSEASTRCVLEGMQILGGYSYMVEYPMERWYRETKLYEIAGGSNQILRNVMVQQLRKAA